MGLPQARTTEQRLMVTMCELLGEQNSLLAELRDRLSPGDGQGQPVTDGSSSRAVKLAEPDPPPASEPHQPVEPEPTVPEQAVKPARQRAAKKTTAASRRTAKGST